VIVLTPAFVLLLQISIENMADTKYPPVESYPSAAAPTYQHVYTPPYGSTSNINNQQQPQPAYVIHEIRDNSLPIGLILFIGGFLFMPLWWVAACITVSPFTDKEREWRQVNQIMTCLTLGLGVCITVVTLVIFGITAAIAASHV
jgi:hypothetical protein